MSKVVGFLEEVSDAIGQGGLVTPLTTSVAFRVSKHLMDFTREQLVASNPVFAGLCQDLEREVIADDEIAIPGLLPAKKDALKRYTIRRDKKNPMAWVAPRRKRSK